MGQDWIDPPFRNSPMDSSGKRRKPRKSGGGDKKGCAIVALAALSLPVGLLSGFGLWLGGG